MYKFSTDGETAMPGQPVKVSEANWLRSAKRSAIGRRVSNGFVLSPHQAQTRLASFRETPAASKPPDQPGPNGFVFAIRVYPCSFVAHFPKLCSRHHTCMQSATDLVLRFIEVFRGRRKSRPHAS
jgi:hypothetical protein